VAFNRRPTDKLTRAEYVAELFRCLDKNEIIASNKGWREIAAELRIAKRVLGATLAVDELLDLEALYKLEEEECPHPIAPTSAP
jgi:hypothetical protein